MYLIKHDYLNRSDSSFEASWNMKIALIAFVAACFMFWPWVCEKLQQKHNREVLALRAWRFRNGWRPR